MLKESSSAIKLLKERQIKTKIANRKEREREKKKQTLLSDRWPSKHFKREKKASLNSHVALLSPIVQIISKVRLGLPRWR